VDETLKTNYEKKHSVAECELSASQGKHIGPRHDTWLSAGTCRGHVWWWRRAIYLYSGNKVCNWHFSCILNPSMPTVAREH